MRFPDKFDRIDEGVLIAFTSINDYTIKLSDGLIIKGRFFGKQNLFFGQIARIGKKYFIAIYEDSGVLKGRILTITDFKNDVYIRAAIVNIPNYIELFLSK